MIRAIRLIFFTVFKKLLPSEKLISFIENDQVERNKKNCTIGKNTVLWKDSLVLNTQNNPLNIVIGDNSFIRAELVINYYGGKIMIGNNTFIGEHSKIWSGNEIRIGDNVQIAHNVNIIDTNTHSLNYLNRRQEYSDIVNKGYISNDEHIHSSPIIIEDDVWISFNATILKGVTIGKGAVVAAHAVVTKNVEPFTLVIGNPAKAIKKL